MRAGEFADGSRTSCGPRSTWPRPTATCATRSCTASCTPRHHRTGDEWCIYPMYDFAHGQSDAIEGITHSLCTLEFEDHRPLYDWFLDELERSATPQQIEFARLNLTYTVMSKRKLLAAGRRRPGARLGRSAHADDLGAAPPRLHAGGDPRLLRPHRRRQGRQHRSTWRCWSTACART